MRSNGWAENIWPYGLLENAWDGRSKPSLAAGWRFMNFNWLWVQWSQACDCRPCPVFTGPQAGAADCIMAYIIGLSSHWISALQTSCIRPLCFLWFHFREQDREQAGTRDPREVSLTAAVTLIDHFNSKANGLLQYFYHGHDLGNTTAVLAPFVPEVFCLQP